MLVSGMDDKIGKANLRFRQKHLQQLRSE